jgi:protein SCO1/2
MNTRLALATVIALTAACAQERSREYELRGVVVRVDPSRQEITIKHDDIPRFMPGMTMPFRVRDPQLLTGRVPGDLVRATLVLEGSDAHLRALERTGSAPVPPAPEGMLPDILEPGASVPDAAFTDHEGRRRRLSDWRGRALAVTFTYTRCPLPNFCPAMDRHFKAAQDMVRRDPELQPRVHLVSVSFDPDYDRPRVLASHARQLDADPAVWSFVTGEREEIDRFASRFGVSVIREGASPREIVHNLRTAIIDANGRLAVIVRDSEWTPADLIGELRKSLARR